MKNLPKKILNIKKISKKFNVPKFIYFNHNEYKRQKRQILNKIKTFFDHKIIVRSASNDEDAKFTNAGKYLSISNISKNDYRNLNNAISSVFASYGERKNQFIIVQEYINNADSVGVIFTRDPKNGAPFRTINFNDSSQTSIITSGKENGKIIYYFKEAKISFQKKKINLIDKTIRKLEKYFLSKNLDVEFLTLKEKIYILQVRQLNLDIFNKNINFKKSLKDLEKKLLKMQTEKSLLLGKERFFSTMTDWNPAEIIGLKPKPLSISLYKYLITDNIWAKSRADLGYNDLSNAPLLYSFLGTPYIDVRTDINSFLTNSLTKKINNKLVNFYLKEFKKNPNYYFDKIESKLVINCISLNINKYRKILSNSKLSKTEVLKVIRKYKILTESIISKLNSNIQKYKNGEKLFLKIKKSDASTINKIYLLSDLCINHGTLPFANIARMSFIGVEFLNSFVELKIINQKDKDLFLESLNSISTEMNTLLSRNRKSEFLRKFGHLRPNTYEISNKNYMQDFNLYFGKKTTNKSINKKFNFTSNQYKEINNHLLKKGFNIKVKELITFIKSSIAEREASKLFFTKIIDEIFNQLRILFSRIGLNQNNLQYLDFNEILILYNKFSHENIDVDLNRLCLKNKKEYDYNINFNLPNIITNSKNIYYFEEKNASPTFITNKTITSELIFLNDVSKKININDKIICIENADPGFEFIFNHKIKGLITAFGGPNSHMSIRCNEFSIPAAIGIGEKKFQQLIKNNILYLNCEKKILSRV